jgi:ArsR family transcriptional regulator, lead/cadmium/zinc/bismuth-responsive transcriptional repressor
MISGTRCSFWCRLTADSTLDRMKRMNTYDNDNFPGDDTCHVNLIDPDKIELAQQNLPETVIFGEAAEIFRLLGDPSRLRILKALSVTELCVCDLATLLGASSSAVSHQLRLLRAKGFVRYRRQGKMAYYALADRHVQQLLAQVIAHIEECETNGYGRELDREFHG